MGRFSVLMGKIFIKVVQTNTHGEGTAANGEIGVKLGEIDEPLEFV